MNLLVTQVVVKIPKSNTSTWETVLPVLISGIFLLLGAVLAFYGVHRSNKNQMEITKMQIDEKLNSETRLQHLTEVRKIAVELVELCLKIKTGPALLKEINQFSELQKDIENGTYDANKIKSTMMARNKLEAELDAVMPNYYKLVGLIERLRFLIVDAEEENARTVLNLLDGLDDRVGKSETLSEGYLDQVTNGIRQYIRQESKKIMNYKSA